MLAWPANARREVVAEVGRWHPHVTGFLRQSRIPAARLQCQELRFDERIQHSLAGRPLDPGEAHDLIDREAHAWHFGVFAADARQEVSIVLGLMFLREAVPM